MLMRQRRWWRMALLVLIPFCTFAQAPSADEAPLPIPETLQAGVAASESTGRTLQRLDRAAWIATDALQEDRSARKARKAVRGWITETVDVGTRVSFFDGSMPPTNAYDIVVESSGRVASASAPAQAALSENQHALIRARQAALARPFTACARSYNSVAFASGNAIHVYLMPGRTQQDVHPAGGHYLLVYDADGRALRSERAFTRSCLELGGRAPSGRTAALMATHLLDPHPTEIHVFISLNAGMPLYVATTQNGHLWKVDDGVISLMKGDAGASDG